MSTPGKVLLALVFAGVAPLSWAQTKEFPVRPVRVVVPVPPGGSVDVMTRILAPKWGELMGQNVIVDYRPGANSIVGSEHVARAPADGYTLLISSLPHVVNPSLYRKMPFDTERDFAPVSLLGSTAFVLVVHPSLPVKSVKELIALAKAQPGKLNYSSAGNGSNLHVAAELFKNLTGTNIVHVPYSGGGPALLAMLNGETGVSFLSLVAVTGHIANGGQNLLFGAVFKYITLCASANSLAHAALIIVYGNGQCARS